MNTQLDIKLSALDLVALTIWGEARSLDIPGRIAVGLVIAHRVSDPRLKYGEGWSQVVLRPWQFSCWQEIAGPANHAVVQQLAAQIVQGNEPKGPSVWTECLWIAEGVMENAFMDSVHGATHYLTRALYEQKPPGWVRGQTPVVEIGPHLFFKL